jgi:translation initiation factor 2 subunit 3
MGLPRQPEVNVGLIGHVDHGKTTLTQKLTGRWTDVHSEEVKRGISIKLGYADAAFYRYKGLEPPSCFGAKPKGPNGEEGEFLRAVSFVDAPGHETLMAIMLSGAAIMDGALLMVAANEKCPQPQTREHLVSLEITGAKNVVIVQNKIDLVTPERAKESHEEIKRFVKGSVAEDAPIIPISAHHDVNLDALIEAIEETIPTPKRDPKANPLMFAARSFDINRPGYGPKQLSGGIIGGSLVEGSLKLGDEIEVGPGRLVEHKGQTGMEPITTTITSLICGGVVVDEVLPGGLLAIGTELDPSLTKSDSLSGKLVGHPGKLPPVWQEFTIDVNLLPRVVGSAEDTEVEPVKTREPLMLTVGTATTVGVVASARADQADVKLKLPVCAKPGQRIGVSRRVGGRWRLIGHGVINK